jgi:hypothetical protein
MSKNVIFVEKSFPCRDLNPCRPAPWPVAKLSRLLDGYLEIGDNSCLWCDSLNGQRFHTTARDMAHTIPQHDWPTLNAPSWRLTSAAGCWTPDNNEWKTLRPVKPISTKSAIHVRSLPTERAVIFPEIPRMQLYLVCLRKSLKFNQNHQPFSIKSIFFVFWGPYKGSLL